MTSQLESLRRFSVVVADSGELDAIGKFRPQDATTNPTLIHKAAQQERYRDIVEAALEATSSIADRDQRAEALIEELYVGFGRRILEIIPGRVSTEVDARLSFDEQGTERKARRLVERYARAGVPAGRVLIKIASTWEGVRVAGRLERDGVHCNLTLMFCLAQAAVCADAGVTLISPFVGRIYDWHRAARGVGDIPREDDPGVASVVQIYRYLKKFGFPTQVMGASFRKATQILDLAGCDLLTISPELLAELAGTEGEVARRLSVEDARASDAERLEPGEEPFRWRLNEDAMATEKLAEGIRRFHADGVKLVEFAFELARRIRG
jgi:transaldolase